MATSKTESYTELRDRDVEAVGAHCQLDYCGIRDLLPFKCESCKGIYCLEHRSETSHKCPKAGEWARRRNAQNAQMNASLPSMLALGERAGKACAKGQCETRINTSLVPGVHCANCNREYCLKHRMEEDHDCKNLTPIGARPGRFTDAQKTANSAKNMFSKWITGKREKEQKGKVAEQPRARQETKRDPVVQALIDQWKKRRETPSTPNDKNNILKNLKLTAKGDPKIPQTDRIYVFVEASADTTKFKFPTGKFFYSKNWTIGRVLDAAAKSLQVENVNNHGGGEKDKLRVFHVEQGKLLQFGEKLGDCCISGNTLVLLRGVGEPSLMM